MTQKEEAYKVIAALVERFGEQFASYKKAGYNETLTRRDFIDPFFKALGWGIDNHNGYANQFAGEPERKITKRRFKELIVSLQNIPMHEQGKALEKYIADFKGSIHQTDDILVIGVRV